MQIEKSWRKQKYLFHVLHSFSLTALFAAVDKQIVNIYIKMRLSIVWRLELLVSTWNIESNSIFEKKHICWHSLWKKEGERRKREQHYPFSFILFWVVMVTVLHANEHRNDCAEMLPFSFLFWNKIWKPSLHAACLKKFF